MHQRTRHGQASTSPLVIYLPNSIAIMSSSKLPMPVSDYFSRPAGHFTNNPPTPTPSAFQLRLPTNVKRTSNKVVSTTALAKPAAGASPKQASMLALPTVLSNGQTALQASCYPSKYPVKDVYLWIPPRSNGKVRQTLAKFRQTQPDRHFLLYLETRTLSEHPEVSEAYFIGHLDWSATAQSWTVRFLNTRDQTAKPSK